jgi:hypothetical protein
MAEMVRCPQPKILGEPQSLATLCWFACYTMMARWKGWEEKSIAGELKSRLAKGGIDLEEAGRSGLKLKENLKAAKAIGLGARGFGQPVSLWNIQELLAYSPVWATGQWMAGNNHVYVIVGASEQWVEYYDPWWEGTPEDAFNVKKAPTDWILNGDGKQMLGLASTFQWFPLQYWKE